MSLVGFKGNNHPQQTRKRGARPEVDNLATTPEVFDPLHERFGFTIDVAALPHNAKLERYWTPDDCGLVQSWAGERVWCNPPYSDIGTWVQKAWDEWNHGASLIVMLLPANRTEQGWWQALVEPQRLRGELRVEFLPGRLRFIKHGYDKVEPNQRPPFGCCLLVWQRNGEAGEVAAVTRLQDEVNAMPREERAASSLAQARLFLGVDQEEG